MRKAFTMMEFVIVIVLIGILSAVFIPRMSDNNAQLAAIKLQAAIRYTQHLAMMEDKYGSSTDWYKHRWHISIDGNKYTVASIDANNVAVLAVDPENKSQNLEDVDLGSKYGVTISVTGTECGAATTSGEHNISFDSFGRPMSGEIKAPTPRFVSGSNGGYVVTNDCTIVVTEGTNTANIHITPETGYTYTTH